MPTTASFSSQKTFAVRVVWDITTANVPAASARETSSQPPLVIDVKTAKEAKLYVGGVWFNRIGTMGSTQSKYVLQSLFNFVSLIFDRPGVRMALSIQCSGTSGCDFSLAIGSGSIALTPFCPKKMTSLSFISTVSMKLGSAFVGALVLRSVVSSS